MWYLLLAALVAIPARAETLELCGLRIESGDGVKLSGIQEKWLCGDPDTYAWREIPLNQKKRMITNFLQAQGYQSPRFTEEDGVLVVSAGARTITERFTVVGAPPEWNWAKRRKVIGAPLQPSLLDGNEKWAARELRFRGYPCPKVQARGIVDTAELLLEVDPGPKQDFGAVTGRGEPGLDPRITERFTAFGPDQPFDVRLLELTSQRILAEDLFLSTFYDPECDADRRVRIVRHFIDAPPRLITAGAGFDTENGPLARARFRRARIGENANSFEATTFLSFRRQHADSGFRWHFRHDPASRVEFDPFVTVERQSELQFETMDFRFDPWLAKSWEFSGFQLAAAGGPTIERLDTHRGRGPAREDTIRLSAKVSATSHLFEYYASDPRTGWYVALQGWHQVNGVLARLTEQRLFFEHKLLWNLGLYEPPYAVLGWRGFAGTFLPAHSLTALNTIGVSERFFLGGDDDIRGFGRKKLPGNGLGYFATLYQGLELRFVDLLPAHLQPFLFLDFADGGDQPAALGPSLYYAPGFGIRWGSPIGTMRTNLARGYISEPRPQDPVPGWQLFFSLGREF